MHAPAERRPGGPARAPAGPLSREAVVDAAVDLVDEEGPAGLTMRVLGQRLGVTATALYHYVPGRDELLLAVVDRVGGDIVASLPAGGDPLGRVRGLLEAVVAGSAAHPTAAAWALTTYARRPPVLQIHESLLAALRAAGLSTEAAVVAKGALVRLVVGHLVVQEAPPGRDWQTLSRREFPETRAAGPVANRIAPAQVLSVGLDALLEGLGLGAGPAPAGRGA